MSRFFFLCFFLFIFPFFVFCEETVDSFSLEINSSECNEQLSEITGEEIDETSNETVDEKQDEESDVKSDVIIDSLIDGTIDETVDEKSNKKIDESSDEESTKENDEINNAKIENTAETECINQDKNQKVKKELTISGSERPEVESFRKIYMNEKSQKQLNDILENAITYRLYVRRALIENNLPPELEYLPIVESNYKTHAKSKSGAIGLWQFMSNSVKPFLILNDYVDERYDPWKSTDAALKKLSDNYNYFQDWAIAIAAYNCGTGAMIKALSKSPVKDFWYMVEHNYLPKQTAQYVPKLLAIADLAINHEFYEINLTTHEKEFEILYNEKHGLFDYISVSKAYSLKQLALEMRIDTDTILELNPSFIRGFTHPSQQSTIRLPLGTKTSALLALKNITPIDFPVKYKVVSGDSLWAISRRYGTTVKAICELNGINENDILKIGKILYIPSK